VGTVYIDAAVMALNHDFLDAGIPLSAGGTPFTIYQVGSIVENYAESVQLSIHQADAEEDLGSDADIYWDPRLSVLSPPYFFESGKSGGSPNWSLTSSSVSLATPCSGLTFPPPLTAPSQGSLTCSPP
jgi:hypothetical protein